MTENTLLLAFVQDTISRIKWTHDQIQRIAEEQSAEELGRHFGPTAPPIGWHIWHIIRWADRLQATLPTSTEQPDPDNGIWQQQQLAAQWDLDPAQLGLFESGVEMALDDAMALPMQVGQEALARYARNVVQRTVPLLDGLNEQTIATVRPGIRNFSVEAGKAIGQPKRETDVWGDLSFHLSHSSRHLGMMEALRGLLHRRGTASI